MKLQENIPLRTLGGHSPQLPSEIAATKGFVAGIMGEPDAGKTTLLHTLAEDESTYPIAFLSHDGGAHVLKDEYSRNGRIQIYPVNSWSEYTTKVDELARDPRPFKTVWVDVMSNIADLGIDHYEVHEIDENNTQQRRKQYGESNWDLILNHKKLIVELAERHGINIFFVYWQTYPVVIEGSGTTVKSRHIALSPAMALKVRGILDVIIGIEKQEGLNPYPPRMRLYGAQGYDTRLRLNPENPLKKWPPLIDNPNLAKVVRAFHGEIIDP